jgi:L-ascorbate 6-phosphate lactonase
MHPEGFNAESMSMKKMSMKQIKARQVPARSIAIWWLGQAGFVVKSPKGVVLALDPYLSNSCKKIGEENNFRMDRQVPPPLAPKDLIGIDGWLFTHSHQDHLDPETIQPFIKAGGSCRFLAPAEALERLHSLGVPEQETTLVWPNKSVTFGDLTVRATFAIPFGGDDLTHVGYLFFVKGGPTVYFTGDTAFHDILVDAVAPHQPDVLVAVINGAFRNLGPAEAAILAKRLKVKTVIPCHHDLFLDNCQPPQMLHTNLKLQGIGDSYRLLEQGAPVTISKS